MENINESKIPRTNTLREMARVINPVAMNELAEMELAELIKDSSQLFDQNGEAQKNYTVVLPTEHAPYIRESN